MSITITKAARFKLETWAKKEGLDIEVVERTPGFYCGSNFEQHRWYAKFKGVDVSEPSVLVGAFGDGPTPAKAIRAYAARISEQKLVLDAFTPTQRDIYAPVLY